MHSTFCIDKIAFPPDGALWHSNKPRPGTTLVLNEYDVTSESWNSFSGGYVVWKCVDKKGVSNTTVFKKFK